MPMTRASDCYKWWVYLTAAYLPVSEWHLESSGMFHKYSSSLDLNFENGDLKTIPYWTGPTFHQATETALYYTSLTGLDVQKSSEKAQTLPKDHLELPLKPRWTTNLKFIYFQPGKKRFTLLLTSIWKIVTWNHSQLSRPNSSPNHWNSCLLY